MQLVERNPDLEIGVDSKAMLAKANEEKRKIKYQDRMAVEVVKDTRFYVKGQKLNPHPLVAEQLISNKIAKAI